MTDPTPAQQDVSQEKIPLLPLWSTVNKVYGLVWRHRSTYLRITAVWMPLVFLTQWFCAYLALPSQRLLACSSPAERARLIHSPFFAHAMVTLVLLLAVNMLISLFIIPSIAVGWHRLLLRDESPAAGAYLRYDRPVVSYMLLALLLMVIYMAPSLVMGFLFAHKHPMAMGMILSAAVLLLSFVWVTRLLVMLPSRALERKDITLKLALRRTRWNFWRIFWAGFFCSLPLFALVPFVPQTGCGTGNIAAAAVYAFPLTINLFVLTPFYLTFLSIAYKHFFEHGQPESAAVRGTPRFPLKTAVIVLLALGIYGAWHKAEIQQREMKAYRRQHLAQPTPTAAPALPMRH